MLAALTGGLGGALLGYLRAPAEATFQLVADESSTALIHTDRPDPLGLRLSASGDNLVEILKAPGLFQQVGARLDPPVSEATARHMVSLDTTGERGRVQVRVRGSSDHHALAAARLFGELAMEHGRVVRELELEALSMSVSNRLTGIEESLVAVGQELSDAQQAMGPEVLDAAGEGLLRQFQELDTQEATTQVQIDTLKLQIDNLLVEIRKHHPALLQARQELDQALLRYTDQHPRVQELKTNLAMIESKLVQFGIDVDPAVALHGSSLAQNLYSEVIQLRTRTLALTHELSGLQQLKRQLREKIGRLPAHQAAYASLKTSFDSINRLRDQLIQRRQELRLLAAGTPGLFQILQEPRLERPADRATFKSARLWGAWGGLLGLAGGALLVGVRERCRRRISNEEELHRITGLPLLASLGDLEAMDDQARDQWAFQTFTRLKGMLTATRHESFVCGFLSATHGEGRSTWVRLLAEAARKRGYRVLTIATSSGPGSSPGSGPGCGFDGDLERVGEAPEAAGLEEQVVTIPSELTKSLSTTTAQPIVNIQPLDWVWDLKCRDQWQEALRKCRGVDNLVVLVDLPPACEEETFLLSEDLSQVIWLCGRGMAGIDETVAHVHMLKYSRTGMVGAVMNRSRQHAAGTGAAPRPAPRSWMQAAGTSLGLAIAASMWLALAPQTSAQTPGATPAPQARPGADRAEGFSILGPAQMAAWQQRLTVGPGDVFDLSIYQRPESARPGVAIGPDGRLTYLLAQDVPAAGLTIDELRDRIASALIDKGFRAPLKIIAVPRAFNSKKYYILGNVVRKGVFPLDRPMTLLEGIAQAGGFVPAPAGQNSLMLADLSRSFLVRQDGTNGFDKVGVNFEDLFLRGDLTQNIALAPEDYLYFPPMDLQEVYVLGEIARPGVVLYTPEMTLMRAIVSQAGFTPQAFRQRVLVVRGSLNVPQKFVVNVKDILDAQSPDFKLEPRDIIYVSRKPWALAEELVELAITEFLRAAVTSWTGQHVGPFIDEPIIK